jgi:hypothetical protein
MNRYHLLSIAAVLVFAPATQAQLAASGTDASAMTASSVDSAGFPPVETQLKILTDQLGLSEAQQRRVRAILKGLHSATEKIARDKTLSQQQRLAKVRPERYRADQEMREVLNEDQKKKLDQYEAGPHGEMHGNLNGANTPQH